MTITKIFPPQESSTKVSFSYKKLITFMFRKNVCIGLMKVIIWLKGADFENEVFLLELDKVILFRWLDWRHFKVMSVTHFEIPSSIIIFYRKSVNGTFFYFLKYMYIQNRDVTLRIAYEETFWIHKSRISNLVVVAIFEFKGTNPIQIEFSIMSHSQKLRCSPFSDFLEYLQAACSCHLNFKNFSQKLQSIALYSVIWNSIIIRKSDLCFAKLCWPKNVKQLQYIAILLLLLVHFFYPWLYILDWWSIS